MVRTNQSAPPEVEPDDTVERSERLGPQLLGDARRDPLVARGPQLVSDT
jgi:hypothetical protein